MGLFVMFVTRPAFLVVRPAQELGGATGDEISQQGGAHYAAARTRVGTAADGDHVLTIQGWDLQGSSICGPPLELAAKVYSGTISVRSIGKGTTGTTAMTTTTTTKTATTTNL